MPALDLRAAGIELARRTRAVQKLPRRVRDRETARKVASLIVSRRGA